MKLWILTTDSDDQYTATLHATRADAEAEVVTIFGESANTDDPQTAIEYAQDTGVEVNITEAEVPGLNT